MPDLAETTLWKLVEARAAATPDALLVVDEHDRTMTFAEYRDACPSGPPPGWPQLGVGEGTPVSWQLPTWIESFVLVGALAAARRGAEPDPADLPRTRGRAS